MISMDSMSSGLMSLRRLAPAPPRCAGPRDALASMRTPSMYTIGSVLSDRLPTERTRICAPVPTWPVAGRTMTPGVRAPISCSTLRGADVLRTSFALMLSMTLPTARRSTAPPVPVTTT